MKKQKHHKFSLDSAENEFDELWIADANVHIERMNETGFWIGIDPPKSSGLPSIMLNTGVYKGEWFFNLEEDCSAASRFLSVRRPRNSKMAMPPGPAEKHASVLLAALKEAAILVRMKVEEGWINHAFYENEADYKRAIETHPVLKKVLTAIALAEGKSK